MFAALGGGVLRGHVDVDSSVVNYLVGCDGIVRRASCRGGTGGKEATKFIGHDEFVFVFFILVCV